MRVGFDPTHHPGPRPRLLLNYISQKARVPGMRTGAQGSYDEEFHSGCGSSSEWSHSRSRSRAEPELQTERGSVFSLGERRRAGYGPVATDGVRGRAGDQIELGPEGGGRGSEGGLGPAGQESRGEVRKGWENWS